MNSSAAGPAFDRRALLRGAILLVGGSLAGGLPTVTLAAETPEGRFFTPTEFEALSQVADIIIPPTDTPGALQAGVPEALDSLMVKWASEERQAEFRALMGDYLSAGVLTLSASDKFELVRRMDARKLEAWEQPYVKFKELVLTLYYLSEAGATQELRYELIPGKFEPWTQMAPDERAWAV